MIGVFYSLESICHVKGISIELEINIELLKNNIKDNYLMYQMIFFNFYFTPIINQ